MLLVGIEREAEKQSVKTILDRKGQPILNFPPKEAESRHRRKSHPYMVRIERRDSVLEGNSLAEQLDASESPGKQVFEFSVRILSVNGMG